jgi:hypothetical protein
MAVGTMAFDSDEYDGDRQHDQNAKRDPGSLHPARHARI